MKIQILILSCMLASSGISAEDIPPKWCSEEIGKEEAAKLVQQCLQVSPATHPPCDANNSCEMIRNEIDRGCGFLVNKPYVPEFCKPYRVKSGNE